MLSRACRTAMFALLLTAPVCAQSSPPAAAPPNTSDPTATSTREMGATLRQLFFAQDWKTDPNKQEQRAAYYRGVLKRPLDLPTEITIRQALANELLGAGDSAAAVNTLEALFSKIAEQHALVPTATLQVLHAQLGLAFLRLGEQQNCLAHHATRSCLFPIDAGGMHHRPEGAEGAVREFTAVLTSGTNEPSARWLLNLAYMQLGQYPDRVPRQWLIPSSLFRSEFPLPRFDDVAAEAGLGITGHAGGAIMEDFDGDGLLDIAVSSSGPMDQMHLFHNRGDGTFEDVTRQAGLLGELGGLNMTCADYDNDGHPDLVVLRGGWWAKHGAYPFSLLHNRGDGTFEDVTRKAGLFSPHPTQTAVFLDFDNDGWLDLFVPHESTPGDAHAAQLFHNNHDGTFTDIAAASGVSEFGFVKGVAAGDYNNDGRPDLYVSIKGAPNRLFRNDGPFTGDDPVHPTRWRFTDVTAAAHVAEPIESFTTWFFDYDNDGWPDLFVVGYSSTPQEIGAFEAGLPSKAETPRLYHNEHNGTFRDVTREVHLDRAILIMGASFGDLDNDGWLDVYLGTGDSLYTSLLPNRMFRNDEGRRFQDVTTAGGFGHLQKGHSIAFGDIDNDGDEDIFEEMGGALPGDSYQSVLYRSPGTPGTHSITLSLTGTRSNRSAIGAVIRVMVPGTHGPREIYRSVGYTSSFGGNPLRQHIGVGASSGPVTVTVHWPTSNTTQIFRRVAVDKAYAITEGNDVAEATVVPKFRLPDPKMPMSMMQEAGP
jgi:hypothetical protein